MRIGNEKEPGGISSRENACYGGYAQWAQWGQSDVYILNQQFLAHYSSVIHQHGNSNWRNLLKCTYHLKHLKNHFLVYYGI